MITWAALLQRAGYKTGILSNIGDAMEAGILARFDWLQSFHHHTFSHRLGIAKPDLAIYRYAAQGLGEDPSHILFIDDREDNVQAARKAGMVAVQYSSHAEFVAAMHAAGLQNLLHPCTPS
jgi:putative hydrolase of the HAD superfamily